MRRPFLPAPLALAAVALAGCSQPAATPLVSDAWVRLAPLPDRPAAGYFTLGATDEGTRRVLVGVESASVQRIEMHESMKMAGSEDAGMSGAGGGMMTMRPIARLSTETRPLRFEPGGYHLMLFGLAREAAPGGFLPLVFRFADGGRVSLNARIVGAADGPPEGSDG